MEAGSRILSFWSGHDGSEGKAALILRPTALWGTLRTTLPLAPVVWLANDCLPLGLNHTEAMIAPLTGMSLHPELLQMSFSTVTIMPPFP